MVKGNLMCVSINESASPNLPFDSILLHVHVDYYYFGIVIYAKYLC